MKKYLPVATKGRKFHRSMRRVVSMGKMRMVQLEASDVPRAFDLHLAHQLSIWDAKLVQAARKGGGETLYTEELQDGRKFGNLTVVKPFRVG